MNSMSEGKNKKPNAKNSAIDYALSGGILCYLDEMIFGL